jgi:hypothetical protein
LLRGLRRSNTGTMSSHASLGMDVCIFFFLWLCCSVYTKSLRRADRPSVNLNNWPSKIFRPSPPPPKRGDLGHGLQQYRI